MLPSLTSLIYLILILAHLLSKKTKEKSDFLSSIFQASYTSSPVTSVSGVVVELDLDFFIWYLLFRDGTRTIWLTCFKVVLLESYFININGELLKWKLFP